MPYTSYRLGLTFLVQNKIDDADEESKTMEFSVVGDCVIKCKVDGCGVYYVEQEVKTDTSGCLVIGLKKSISGFYGNIKIEAHLAR